MVWGESDRMGGRRISESQKEIEAKIPIIPLGVEGEIDLQKGEIRRFR